MDARLAEIERRMRLLKARTQGIEGAVLQKTDPEDYERKKEELAETTREYFRYFFGFNGPPMP